MRIIGAILESLFHCYFFSYVRDFLYGKSYYYSVICQVDKEYFKLFLLPSIPFPIFIFLLQVLIPSHKLLKVTISKIMKRLHNCTYGILCPLVPIGCCRGSKINKLSSLVYNQTFYSSDSEIN